MNITIISVLALCYIFYNQIRVKTVRQEMKFILPIIMLIFGFISLKNYLTTESLTLISITCIILSLTVLAGGMAALRAHTVKIWAKENLIYRQGTWLTIILWIISVILHLLIEKIGDIGQSTTLIYFAITLSIQKWIIRSRAQKLIQSKTN